MVFLSENRFAEKPRPTLGGASSKGHSLQHCIENNSQTRNESKKPGSVALVHGQCERKDKQEGNVYSSSLKPRRTSGTWRVRKQEMKNVPRKNPSGIQTNTRYVAHFLVRRGTFWFFLFLKQDGPGLLIFLPPAP